MADQPILFVAGLGRCGTTMVMTMLDAGGFPVSGPRPAYEPYERWVDGRPDMTWLHQQAGRAVKWIDPTRHLSLPGRLPVRPVVILLTRNAVQQAASQCKLIKGDWAHINFGRHGVRAMARSIRRDVPVMRAMLRRRAHVHEWAFEDFLQNPWWGARALSRLVGEHFNADLNAESACGVVVDRLPGCLPDMRIEQFVLPKIAAGLGAQP